jgi:hypothetical protein
MKEDGYTPLLIVAMGVILYFILGKEKTEKTPAYAGASGSGPSGSSGTSSEVTLAEMMKGLQEAAAIAAIENQMSEGASKTGSGTAKTQSGTIVTEAGETLRMPTYMVTQPPAQTSGQITPMMSGGTTNDYLMMGLSTLAKQPTILSDILTGVTSFTSDVLKTPLSLYDSLFGTTAPTVVPQAAQTAALRGAGAAGIIPWGK